MDARLYRKNPGDFEVIRSKVKVMLQDSRSNIVDTF